MKKRIYISKKTRQEVYKKYNGHCAYCGKKLEYKDMQVDHIIAYKYKNEANKVQIDSLDNLNPACRRCNFFKRTKGLDGFKLFIKNLLSYLNKFSHYKAALDFGLINETPHEIVFYFEKKDSTNN